MSWLPWRRNRSASTAAPDSFGGNVVTSDEGNFRFFGRRRHVAGVPYLLANDQGEMNRLDFQHHLLRQALRGLYAAPIGTPGSILDVGTGTGRWAIDMALTFPNANVIGVDVTTPPVDTAKALDVRPENYTFVSGNVLEGLPFADASFDFVHQRLLVVAIPSERWQQVVNEMTRVTRMGGWVELVEGDLMQGGGSALNQLLQLVVNLSTQRGIDIQRVRRIGELLQGANLQRVTSRELRLPMGPHGGRLGTMLEMDFFTGMTNLREYAVAKGIATADDYDALVTSARQETARGRVQWPVYIAYGQRR